MHFGRGRYRHFLTVICGRNFALIYGEILDPNLPLLGCKTSRGLAFRTGPPDRRTSRFAAALQQSWPVPLGPLGARAITLFNRNSASCLMLNLRGRPALATAVARSYGFHAFGHAVGSRDDEEPCIGCETWNAKVAIDGSGALRFDHHHSCPALVLRLRVAGLANRSV